MDISKDYVGEYSVYMHVHKKSGRKYIGIAKDVKKRWDNGRGYNAYSPFGKAVLEQGFNSFEHVILNENVTKLLAEHLESFYINYFKSNVPAYGYNVRFHDYDCLNNGDMTDFDGKFGVLYSDAFKEFVSNREFVCVSMVWREYLGYNGKPRRNESNDIAKALDSIDFLERRKNAVRLNEYGSCKVWENNTCK